MGVGYFGIEKVREMEEKTKEEKIRSTRKELLG